MDDQRADLSKAFYVGQSVRSNILDVRELLATELFIFWPFKGLAMNFYFHFLFPGQ